MTDKKLSLRDPFPANQINQKPSGTKAQNQCPPGDKKFCEICKQYHHPAVKHLSYVGHAALTDRLLNVDEGWTWEPLALKDGLPAFDTSGGLWIRLTVNGITRLGYGHAEASSFKEIGAREKEVIGDALRNAAMRFGAALDLWFKGDLHTDEDQGNPEVINVQTKNVELEKEFESLKSSLLDYVNINAFDRPENVLKVIDERDFFQMRKALRVAKDREVQANA